MKNRIINVPATTFTGLANHFRDLHPAGIRGAVDVHSPDFYEGAKRFAYVEGDYDMKSYSMYTGACHEYAELKTFFTRPGEWEELEEIY